VKIKTLIGAGDQIMGFTLPFAIVGIALNMLYPEFFRMNLGLLGKITGIVFLIIGVPIWLTSAVQVLLYVPQRKLITSGPFAILLHPLYTSVALLVLPGVGFLLNTWIGLAIGLVLYFFSRRYSVNEEKTLDEMFSEEYRSYRSRVLLPWL
jgi:protein-S-isoprenylcysteine O-methyltransferase Ste14